MEATTTQFDGCIAYGPWGSSSGTAWDYKPEGFIKKIIVKFNLEYVGSIEFQSCCSKGETQSSRFGATYASGNWTHPICIDYPNEYLVSVSGTYGIFKDKYNVLTSICFKTNQNLYGTFGTKSGTVFSYDAKGWVIVGFHGRYYIWPSAIGVYVMPESPASGLNPICEGKIKNEPCSSMLRMAMPREAGPWGACGGKSWDDGVFSTIKQVRVHLGELNVIYALQFEYLKRDATSVLSQVHGGADGSKVELVNFDGDDEFLIGIFGFYGPVEGYNGLEAIASISFHTNKRIHGPYGEDKGAGYVYYSSSASSGKVVGFHGRNNSFLSAIGVHMEYF